jgi:phosphoesterase RecJ-like protein
MKITSLELLKTTLTTAISKTKNGCIITHVKPDGDGLAAALALQELYPKLNIILEAHPPKTFEFLNADSRCKVFQKNMSFDLVIVLDCHEVERTGVCYPLLKDARIFVIDHHMEQNVIPDSDYYIDSNKVSIGAIIFNLFENEFHKLISKSQKYVAEALYTTLLNDTGDFNNSNVDEETFLMSSKLMRFGLQPGETAIRFLKNKLPEEMRLVGEILSTIETYDNDRILFMNCDLNMLRRNNLTDTSTEKITTYEKGTHGVKVIVFFLETEKGFRLSLRSDFINVNKVAAKFGGGGHFKASGCSMPGSLKENKTTILTELRKQLN